MFRMRRIILIALHFESNWPLDYHDLAPLVPHEFKGDAEMIAKVKVFFHVNDVVCSVFVFAPK